MIDAVGVKQTLHSMPSYSVSSKLDGESCSSVCFHKHSVFYLVLMQPLTTQECRIAADTKEKKLFARFPILSGKKGIAGRMSTFLYKTLSDLSKPHNFAQVYCRSARVRRDDVGLRRVRTAIGFPFK